jgi:hypothetical protein
VSEAIGKLSQFERAIAEKYPGGPAEYVKAQALLKKQKDKPLVTLPPQS